MSAKNDGPLSLKTLLSGVIITVIGGVILAIILGQVGSGDRSTTAPPTAVDPTTIVSSSQIQNTPLGAPPTPTWPSYQPVVRGIIRWNDEPLVGIPVQLCPGSCYTTCDPATATTITDSNGEYRFVQPFQTGVITYTIRAGNGLAGKSSLECFGFEWDVIDSRDPTTFKHDFKIFRRDLVILYPKPESTVESLGTIQWQAYQGASEYQILLGRQIGADGGLLEIVLNSDTKTTRVDVSTKLTPGTYLLQVTALGKYGSGIADGSITFYAR